MKKAFEELLKNLPDLILDTPEAPTLLGNFIARAVADDCLPPKFITTHRENPANEHARYINLTLRVYSLW